MYVYKKKRYICFFAIIDTIGKILFFPFRVFGYKKRERYNNILVIRTDHIGDVIGSTCVLDPLKKAFPEANIDFMVPSPMKESLENNSNIDNVISFDASWFVKRGAAGYLSQIKDLFRLIKTIRERDYDLGIDLRGDFRQIVALFFAKVNRRISYGITGGGFLLTDCVSYENELNERRLNLRLLEPLGVKEQKAQPEIFIGDKGKSEAVRLLNKIGVNDKYAVIHPFPGHVSKMWDLNYFSEIMGYIYEKYNLTSIIVGSRDDKDGTERIIKNTDSKVAGLSGEMTIEGLAGVISGASLFFGVDSGPAHISAALGVPTTILFSGMNDPEKWAPQGENVRIIFPDAEKEISDMKVEDVYIMIDRMLEKKL